MDDPVAVEKIHPGENLPHDVLDPLRSEARRRTLLDVEVEVLVDMLEHEVQHHLAVQPLAVTDVQQSARRLIYLLHRQSRVIKQSQSVST